MKIIRFIFCFSFLLIYSPFCQADDSSGIDSNGGYRGTGSNFGSGWQSDGNGGYRGTGNNFGKGWQSDGTGTQSQ